MIKSEKEALIRTLEGRLIRDTGSEYERGFNNGIIQIIAIIKNMPEIEAIHNQPVDIEKITMHIKDMVVAHEMSHAAYCDSFSWRDDFKDKYKAVLDALGVKYE